MKPTADEESDRVPAIAPDESDDPTDELEIIKPGEKPRSISSDDAVDTTDAGTPEAAEDAGSSPDTADDEPVDAHAGSADADTGGGGSTVARPVESGLANGTEADPEAATGTDAESSAERADDDEWGGLRPLNPHDLVAVDPSSLEDDLDDVDEEGEIIEVAAPETAPASTRRADDLHAGTVLRGRNRPPESGWRRVVYEVSGGMVQPRLSRSQQERVEQLSVIRTLVTQPRRITVLSRKGGVGKTTTTLMLGQTLASQRGDRIIAVDGNPDAGSLGYRVGPQRPESSITDLLNELEVVQRYADMRRFTAQTPSGLEVLMSDDDPQISTALGEAEYGAVMSLLDRFYNLILIDTGTGILDSAVQGILDGTDQIVLVVAPSLDAARAASQTLDWLSEHGFVGLVESAVTVINQARSSALVDIARIEEHFWDRCGATVRIPWDRYLEAGAETELADLRPATREAYLQLASAVARRFEP